MTPPAQLEAFPGMPRLLAGHQALARWTLAGGAAERAPWAWRTQLRWYAWWFDRLSRLQAKRRVQPRPLRPPIFVLGFWRSGTTVLHEWLASLPGHAAPATWQCFNPASFLLTGPPRGDGGRAAGQARPMDAGWIAPDSAQEDEFALLLQGAPSLYRGFIDPRRLDSLAREVLEDTARAGDWVAPWLGFLAGVEQQAGGARLVLKSPNHSFRLDLLEQVFSGTPWVWIGRPAASVWHSNLRMWRSMIATYGLWALPEGQLESFLEACMARYVSVLQRAVATLPDGRVHWVDFDELYADPQALLARLAAWLPRPVDRAWEPEVLHHVLQAHRVTPAGTRAVEAAGPRASLFAAYDAAHARARDKWGAQRR